jgi:L-amino acid N-acyltransferase YncA
MKRVGSFTFLNRHSIFRLTEGDVQFLGRQAMSPLCTTASGYSARNIWSSKGSQACGTVMLERSLNFPHNGGELGSCRWRPERRGPLEQDHGP